MSDIDRVLDDAGLHNAHVHEFVRHWAEHTGAARVEVVSAADDARLIAGVPGRRARSSPRARACYYSRSYCKDTARSEERTIVATSDPADKGVYNNWRPTREMRPIARGEHDGRLGGQDDVRHPLPHGPARVAAREVRGRRRAHRPPHRRAAHDPHGAGRPAVHRRARGPDGLRARRPRDRRPAEPRPGHPRRPALLRHDRATSARSCTSAPPTAATPCSARSRTVCAWRPTTAGQSQEFLVRAVHADRHQGQGDREDVPRLRRVPERLGQDQPRDDAARRTLSETATTSSSSATTSCGCASTTSDGRIYGMNPEYGVFGVAKDTNEVTNPCALDSIAPGTQAALHQRRLQRGHAGGLVGGPHA